MPYASHEKMTLLQAICRHKKHQHIGTLLGICLAIHLSLIYAIQPGQWQHKSEADFSKGTRDNVIITNLGDVKLSADIQTRSDLSEYGDNVFDMVHLKSDKSCGHDEVIIAMGPTGVLVASKLKAPFESEKILSLSQEQIFTLEVTDANQVLVGISSEKNSRIAVLHEGKLKTICTIKDARYIWDMTLHGQTLFVATGIKGQIYQVNLAAMNQHEAAIKPTLILDVKQPNITNIVSTKKVPSGMHRLYFGTDQDGLLYRLIYAQGKWHPYIVYDANAQEISSLHMSEDGTVYFATAANGQSTTGRLTPLLPIKPGKPDEAKSQDDKGNNKTTNKVSETKGKAKSKIEGDNQGQGDQVTVDLKTNKASQSQRDQLREIIRERLSENRQAQANGNTQKRTSGTSRSTGSTGKNAKGNAIYRLDSEGYVTEIFRESVLVLDMATGPEQTLWAATGDEAELYQILPQEDEVATLSDLDPKQLSSMLPIDDYILIASSNPPQLVTMQKEYTTASQGDFVSQSLDASQISLWGQAKIWSQLPKGSSIEWFTRSGNVEDPAKGAWTQWTSPTKLTYDPSKSELSPFELPIKSPPARYLQYKVKFISSNGKSPVLSSVRIKHVSPNQSPQVKAIIIQNTSGKPKGSDQAKLTHLAEIPPAPEVKSNLLIQWKATDPNNDRLIYELSYRRHGESNWFSIAKDLIDTRYLWKTRQVPDGLYYVRVTASDHADNTENSRLIDHRISPPTVVDKAPPVFENIKINLKNPTSLQFQIKDSWNDIQEVRYAKSGEKNWKLILPKDLIFDSTNESIQVSIPDLSSDQATITLRASDVYGNTSYRVIKLK